MRSTSRILTATAVGSLLVTGSQFSAQAKVAHATTPTLTVVASGLDNPRGITWAHNHLYVAQSGHGGTDCPAGAMGPEGGPLCVGRTGSIGILKAGVVQPVISNLFSMTDLPGGVASLGIAAVTATKNGVRAVYNESVVGFLHSLPAGATLTADDSAAARGELGKLITVSGGHSKTLADVGDWDYVWTAINQNLVPDQFPDANANALVQLGNTTYVIDAGANTLVAVDKRGGVRELAFFPNPANSDAVPTCVAIGPDHKNLFIGQLSPGAPMGGSNVYRYNIKSHKLSVWKTGFNVVDGCGFDKRGNFYVVEFQANGFNPGPTGNPAGDVIKIAPNGTRTVIGAGQLFFPQGFATDHSGNIYVDNWSIMTATPPAPGAPTGQIIRISNP
ncbi:MAG: hypothetical protein QOJ83_1426 [Frankiales bacterium]|jgi:hypothetical protein|nr:hypothetical protein [Frankiales bacterium]MDX6221660.1 hypothetical protein [Frankiales bacterium]